MNANFEYYKVFYYVSKYENLTKAASVLKTSQPAVTRTIHNLENILGLFKPSTYVYLMLALTLLLSACGDKDNT